MLNLFFHFLISAAFLLIFGAILVLLNLILLIVSISTDAYCLLLFEDSDIIFIDCLVREMDTIMKNSPSFDRNFLNFLKVISSIV